MEPSMCRIVVYQLNEKDTDEINRRRTTRDAIAQRIRTGQWPIGAQAHIGKVVQEGDEFPLIIIRVNGYLVSGQVVLDGTDVLWVRDVAMGNLPGCWSWPSRVGSPQDPLGIDSQIHVPRPPNCF